MKNNPHSPTPGGRAFFICLFQVQEKGTRGQETAENLVPFGVQDQGILFFGYSGTSENKGLKHIYTFINTDSNPVCSTKIRRREVPPLLLSYDSLILSGTRQGQANRANKTHLRVLTAF